MLDIFLAIILQLKTCLMTVWPLSIGVLKLSVMLRNKRSIGLLRLLSSLRVRAKKHRKNYSSISWSKGSKKTKECLKRISANTSKTWSLKRNSQKNNSHPILYLLNPWKRVISYLSKKITTSISKAIYQMKAASISKLAVSKRTDHR